MRFRALTVSVVLVVLCCTVFAVAQRSRYRSRSYYGQDGRVERNGAPDWKVDQNFKHDLFTFVRIRYESRGRWGWTTDYPDADLNFSFRLQQLTSMHVDPDGKVLDLTDPALFDFPFVYMIEPGYIVLSDEERTALRTYLLNGGFLMVDDFWGDTEWSNFEEEMRYVFPDREMKDVPLDHSIFHCVYDLKERPQIPAIGYAHQLQNGQVYSAQGYGTEEVHYKAFYDDKGRMMAFVCHNTDLGDGWEREGEDPWYFKEFSEKKAYPLGINIIFYAMTH